MLLTIDCYFKAMLAEDIAKIFLNSLCLTGRCLGYSKITISL